MDVTAVLVVMSHLTHDIEMQDTLDFHVSTEEWLNTINFCTQYIDNTLLISARIHHCCFSSLGR